MRPVRKNASPINGDFNKYEDAKPELVSRLGQYCSYCERMVPTLLAVEHIEPKDGDYKQPHLERRWSNFLLACTNCNSSKGSKKVDFKELLFPDRDNTFYAFSYNDDGTVSPSLALNVNQKKLAENTLKLVGLDKPIQEHLDSNGEFVYLDRVGQRMGAISEAQEALKCFLSAPSQEMKNMIVSLAKAKGFFSIWMKVFHAHPDMKILFVRGFNGTELSGCFDMTTAGEIVPSPNHDLLQDGSKI
ncbi:HNH endonuclease [Aeromonas sp. QDB14]|uniref:HNH endonuclease n=1 Tax=Aeromonas sp. QDB14 TaxID=2989836 RepID=UPI0022E529EB|nr:HNH endonuclease [Aeromonas sp. QDB14]